MAKLWESWGVRPVAMIAHSLGEYTAACLAGVFAPDDALHLLCMRGRLMQRLPPGAMLAVQLSETDITPHLLPGLSIAAVNAATRCVVAGPPSAIADLESRLGVRGVAFQRLATEHAFHSAMVEPCLDAFDAVLRRVRMRPPNTPLIADVTGDWLSMEQATDPAYWVRHLRATVRFHDGMRRIASDYPNAVLLEVGPGTTLARLARLTIPAGSERPILASLATPDIEENGVMTALGALWVAGVPIDWSRGGKRRGRRIVLPTYPFERKRYWVPEAGSLATTVGARISDAVLASFDCASGRCAAGADVAHLRLRGHGAASLRGAASGGAKCRDSAAGWCVLPPRRSRLRDPAPVSRATMRVFLPNLRKVTGSRM